MREVDMNNGEFEVHPPGTAEEIALARELSKQIDQIVAQFGKVVPHSVLDANEKLKEHYNNVE